MADWVFSVILVLIIIVNAASIIVTVRREKLLDELRKEREKYNAT